MSSLILPSRRITQPAGLAGIDRRFGNPSVWIPSFGLQDLAGYSPWTATSFARNGVGNVGRTFARGGSDYNNAYTWSPRSDYEWESWLLWFDVFPTVSYAIFDASTNTRLDGGSGIFRVSAQPAITPTYGIDSGAIVYLKVRAGDHRLVVKKRSGAITDQVSSASGGTALSATGRHGLAALNMAVRWTNEEPSDEQLYELISNPWQIVKPATRRIYFDVGAGGGASPHLVAGANSQQPNAATAGCVAQAHLALASNSVQANVAAPGAVKQTHLIAGVASSQPAVASAGSISQSTITYIVGSHSTQNNVASAGSILQTHRIVAAPVAIDHVASASAVVQTHLIGAADSQQANACTAGTVAQDGTTYIVGSHSAQANVASAGGILQTHRIVAAPVAVDHVAAASSIVQTHLIGAAHSVQRNVASSGRIDGGGQQILVMTAGHRPATRLTGGARHAVRLQAGVRRV